MAQTAHSLVPVNTRNLMSIDPQKNWRRYPSVPVPVGGSVPANVPVVAYTGGVANVDEAAGQNGETGTINQTGPAFTPQTQADRAAAANLTPGTTIAPDIGKSYHGTRGSILPYKAYPVGAGKPTDADIPAAFKPAALV